MPNVDVYHSERYGLGEDFSYRLPLDLTKDKKYTLILRFSEVYFWEPDMKVFDVAIGDNTVLRDMDIFSRAGSKLLPHDEFITIEIKKGELFVEGVRNNGGLVKKQLNVRFRVGKADNPKVNALLLVEGGLENTHFDSMQAMKAELIAIAQERMQEKHRAELLFNEDSYDFDERIDGQGFWN